MNSAKPVKSKNRNNVDLDGSNPNLRKIMIEIFTRQPYLQSFMGVCNVETFRELDKILIKPSGTFI